MAHAALHASQALAYVALLDQLGYDRNYVINALRQRIGGLTTRQYSDAYAAGILAQRQGDDFNTVPPGGRLDARFVPGYNPARTGFRFTVNPEIYDAASGVTRTTTESFYFASNPTRNDVTAAVTAYVAALQPNVPAGGRRSPPPAPWQLIRYTVLTVERA